MTSRAAAPGNIFTSTRCTAGRVPVTLAITLTGMVPVDPDMTNPVESTRPSNRPPADWNRILAFSTGLPAESSAWA
jgi:hypothetical protein